MLQALVTANSAPGSDTARLSQRVAASYLAEGQDFNAFDVASRPTGIDRVSAPLLDWDEGFAAYRMAKFDVAASHFETLAQVGSVPNYSRSQAAFWAARASLPFPRSTRSSLSPRRRNRPSPPVPAKSVFSRASQNTESTTPLVRPSAPE